MRDSDEVVSVEVSVDDDAWTKISTLSEAGPEDRVFALDREDGRLVFGDGVHGKIPPVGANLTVSYRLGGGEGGNVALTISARWPFPRLMYLVAVTDRGCQIRTLESVAEGCSGEKRLLYFEGQVLSASDFQDEQAYFLAQKRRHNRWLHGAGIVSGLEITIAGDDEPSVVVSPGYAIDPLGRELIVKETISLCIRDQTSPQFVALEYLGRETDYVPTLDPDRNAPTRIEDCVLAWILPGPEKCEALIIGRLMKGIEGWKVDPTLQPKRSR
jgi:hypothetical protein